MKNGDLMGLTAQQWGIFALLFDQWARETQSYSAADFVNWLLEEKRFNISQSAGTRAN